MNQKKFTLIELLVVIAIIAILAGMLLPMLSSARNRAAEISCAGNIKQLSVGVLQYCQDFDGYVPPCFYSDGTPWSKLIIGYVGNSEKIYKCPKDNFVRTLAGSPRTYSCNASDIDINGKFFPFGAYRKENALIQWGWKIEAVGRGSIYQNSSLSGIAMLGERPGKCEDDNNGIYSGTENTTVDNWWFSTLNGLSGSLAMHKRKANISFMDGHVSSMARGDHKGVTEMGNIWSWNTGL